MPAGVGVAKFSCGGVSLPARSTFAKSAGWAAERLAEKRGATLPPSLIVVMLWLVFLMLAATNRY